MPIEVTIINGVITAGTPAALGDTNGDGNVNALDIMRIKLYLNGRIDSSVVPQIYFDINNDGKVNTLDLMKIKLYLTGKITVLG